MSRHANISIFVPHIGCTKRCSFCNQYTITANNTAPSAKDVNDAVKTAKTSKNYNSDNTELAFFGGSFTAIDRDYMVELLSAAYEFVKNGTVKGIRISTRPDCIDNEVLSVLKSYGVTAIELGCQSMRDEVLSLNHRGHTADDVEKATTLIKQSGFSLGLQMMTGLYGDDDEGAIYTAKRIIALKPDTVRIYPTLVLKNTMLAALMKNGEYSPQSLDSAVVLSAKLLKLFRENDINVIRVGLHTVESDGFLAGPWHPAFGELCESRYMLLILLEMFKSQNVHNGSFVEVYVPKGCLSKMIGQKKQNVEILRNMGYNCTVYEYDKNTISIKEIIQC